MISTGCQYNETTLNALKTAYSDFLSNNYVSNHMQRCYLTTILNFVYTDLVPSVFLNYDLGQT